jgi:hypothetical protein
MCAFFLRIGRARDATQVLVGITDFLLPLEVQVCSLVNAVTYKKKHANKLGTSTTLHNVYYKTLTMTIGDLFIFTLLDRKLCI